MKNLTLLSAVPFLLTSLVNGQNVNKRIQVNDFSVQAGFYYQGKTNGNLNDFKILAPQSLLLNSNFSGFREDNSYENSNVRMLSMMLGLKFRNKQLQNYRTNPILRIGINYYSGTNLMNELTKQTRKTYDTLTSSQTGKSIYLDSVNSQRYSMSLFSQQLRFDASVVFRTNPESRWSLFAGVGVSGGLTINSTINIRYSEYRSAQNPFGDNYFGSFNYNAYFDKTENVKIKNNFVASVYIPMSVDFRIGQKNEFWKRMHLFYEARPSLNITSMSQLNVTNIEGTIQHGLGVKVTI